MLNVGQAQPGATGRVLVGVSRETCAKKKDYSSVPPGHKPEIGVWVDWKGMGAMTSMSSRAGTQ